MNRDDKLKKMRDYCNGKTCANCKIKKENQNHNCGDGKWYHLDRDTVFDKELNVNYAIAFGVKEVKVKKEDKKMNKFKVGDKVRILDGSKIKDYTGGWAMIGYIDNVTTILGTTKRGDRNAYTLHVDNGSCVYDERGLELVEDNKTITITTSDTITTLTDGSHTTTINRYYTDKHDERVAIDYVVKKYYDELNEIDRVSKTPKVGDKVRVVDKELTYDTYKQWLVKNNISIESALKWSNGELPRNGVIFEIIMIVENHVLIENDRECFIIDIKGIEVIK